MTPRYDIFMQSLIAQDLYITQMFLFALAVLAAYQSLAWVPVFFRRPAQAFYLVTMLAVYLFVTVYSWQ